MIRSVGVGMALVLASLGCDAPERGSSEAAANRILNGCDRASAVDARQAAEVEIHFGDLQAYTYEPRCVRVRAGAKLRFTGDFLVHPLAPGRVVEGLPPAHADNPIQETNVGLEKHFVASTRGSFGYYCNVHLAEGMMGAVFVE